MRIKNAAGMSIQGGRKENFYFCLLEYFPEQKRWFLKSLLPVKEEVGKNADQAICDWIIQYGLGVLIVDFPLSLPPAFHEQSNKKNIIEAQNRIDELLEIDQKIYELDPKAYEHKRLEFEQVNFTQNPFDKNSGHILSKQFKRRLKKGLVPYWNRPVDFYIWSEYYDTMLKLFNQSFDSYSNMSMMLFFRMKYLRTLFPKELKLMEGHCLICLLELLREDVITPAMIRNLHDLELVSSARHDIIRQIEQHLNIFIYAHDIELMKSDSRAFNSFLMSLIGKRVLLNEIKPLPNWANEDQCQFVIPNFSF